MSMKRTLHAWCLLSVFFLSSPTRWLHAVEDSIDLKTAMANTMSRNPALVATGYQLQAQQGRVVQAGLKPNPTLDLTVENFAGTGLFEDMGGSETTLSLGWVFERDKRQRRVDAAQAGVSLVESLAEIARLDAAAETARLYIESLTHQATLEWLTEMAASSSQSVDAIVRRVQAGRNPGADLARAEADLARVVLTREDVMHDLSVSNRRLALQWGASQVDFSKVLGNIYSLPEPDEFSVLLARMDRNPDISRYLSRKRLREAELSLAEAQARPDWSFSAGIRRLELTNDQAFVARVSIPLAVRNRNQGLIAEAGARTALNDAQHAAARVETEARLYMIYQELIHSLHRTAALSEEILPRVEKVLVETQDAYQAGRYGYLELRIARDEILNVRADLVTASSDAHRNLIELERLTGATLTSKPTHQGGVQ